MFIYRLIRCVVYVFYVFSIELGFRGGGWGRVVGNEVGKINIVIVFVFKGF